MLTKNEPYTDIVYTAGELITGARAAAGTSGSRVVTRSHGFARSARAPIGIGLREGSRDELYQSRQRP